MPVTASGCTSSGESTVSRLGGGSADRFSRQVAQGQALRSIRGDSTCELPSFQLISILPSSRRRRAVGTGAGEGLLDSEDITGFLGCLAGRGCQERSRWSTNRRPLPSKRGRLPAGTQETSIRRPSLSLRASATRAGSFLGSSISRVRSSSDARR